MYDPQPATSAEPTPLTVTPPVEIAVAADTTSVNPEAFVEPSVSAETKLGRPLEQLAQADGAPASWLWLTKYDQFFVGAFVAVFLMLSGYHWATLGGWGMQPIELERLPERQYDFRIDINSASWVEWTQIEGIGEVTAQKIIEDRQNNGPFRSVNDLLRVKGIGPKKLEMMRPFLREPNEHDSPAKVEP